MVHLWGVTAGEPSFEAAQTAGLASLTLLAQAIASGGPGGASGAGPIRLAVVGSGLAQVLDGDPVHPAKATVLGAQKVVRQELPRLAVGAVDVALPPPDGSDESALDRLAGQILAELADLAAPVEPAVALRGRQRFVRGFAPVRLPAEDAAAAPRLAPGGVYLIAGAAHGPGMEIARHLVGRLGASVGLVLPGDLPPRERWATWSAPPGVPPSTTRRAPPSAGCSTSSGSPGSSGC